MSSARVVRGYLAALGLAPFVAIVFAVGGCIREPSPQLIQVLDVSPREVELGDKIAIFGSGFPRGRDAHLAFRGKLYRPGERPVDDVDIEARATVDDGQRVSLAFDESLATLFAGVGDHAAHTTFDGELEVAFAAAAPGAPPIAATLYKVVLDVRPPAPPAAVVAAREIDGARALAFAGIVASPIIPAAGGLTIEKIAPGSQADLAGMVAGDLLVRFDGVRIDGPSDVVPHPGARSVPVVVRRDGDPREATKELAYDTFKRSAPVELFGAAIVLAVAVAFIVFFVAPSSRGFSWIERGAAGRLASVATEARGRGPGRWLGLFLGATPRDPAALRDQRIRIGAWVGVSALLLLLPAFPAASNVGLAEIFVAVLTSLLVVSLFARRAPGGKGASRIASAAHTLVAMLPAAVSVAAVIVLTGSLRLGDVVAAQGGAPWQWYAFRTPAMAALFMASLYVTLGDAVRRVGTLDEADAGAGSSSLGSLGVAKIVATSAVVAVVFLGGWRVPGVSPAQSDSRLAFAALGGAVFLAKLWGLAGVLVFARRILPAVARGRMTALTLKVLVPVSLLAFGAVVAEIEWLGPHGAFGTGAMVSCTLVALAAIAVAQIVHRLRYALRTPSARGQLNPFL
jgi:NADH-quinone oxidoreductase subunit H